MTTTDLRAEALKLFQIAVDAADPAVAVRRALCAEPMGMISGQVVVLALGKAACAMMQEALHHVTPLRALAVTTAENFRTIPGAEVLVGGHPVPNAGSARAGTALLDAVCALGANDRVLILLSGGGSALAIAPVAGISVAHKQMVNEVLLASGMDITRMNLVRRALSRFKGGGLLGAVAPAQVRSLILSDVIGDDLAVIASGPTVARTDSPGAARKVLHVAGAWDGMPAAVRAVLSADADMSGQRKQNETGKEARGARNQIIGSNRMSLKAMAAGREGAVIACDALVGDVAKAAEAILGAVQQADGNSTLIFGGETTVRVKGDGLGGRNQELALRVALGAKELAAEKFSGNWVFLSGGTDGRDGPTDAAGAIVDGGTVARIEAAGLKLGAVLENNDSYHGLMAAGDLLSIGSTGTNVADVQVFLRHS